MVVSCLPCLCRLRIWLSQLRLLRRRSWNRSLRNRRRRQTRLQLCRLWKRSRSPMKRWHLLMSWFYLMELLLPYCLLFNNARTFTTSSQAVLMKNCITCCAVDEDWMSPLLHTLQQRFPMLVIRPGISQKLPLPVEGSSPDLIHGSLGLVGCSAQW